MASARRCFLAAGELAVEGVAFFCQTEALEQFFGIAAAGIKAGEEFEGFQYF
jgi:hypothetical protein